MLKIQSNLSGDQESHVCESYRVGDWVVFTCPECHLYERRVNWRTGKMKVRLQEGLEHIKHTGNYSPEEYRYAFTRLN